MGIVQAKGSEVIIIDVRTQEELGKTGKIPGSFNVPVKDNELMNAFSLLFQLHVPQRHKSATRSLHKVTGYTLASKIYTHKTYREPLSYWVLFFKLLKHDYIIVR